MTLPDPLPPREHLVEQIVALRNVVERQRLYIGSMRASAFWKVRDALFRVLARWNVRADPLPQPTADDRLVTLAADGDAYQLHRAANRKSASELELLQRLVPLLRIDERFCVYVDTTGASGAALDATMASLAAQLFPHWNAVSFSGTPPLAGESVVCGLRAGDVLEPDALLNLALALHIGADVVYTDSDVLDRDGIPHAPAFKPDWSPELLLGTDYIGRLCAFRRRLLDAAGGFDPRAGSAMFYDALLRVTEQTPNIEHVARVTAHDGDGVTMTAADRRAAVERALERRGDVATIVPVAGGLEVRYRAPADERVTVIIPTRDRADLLDRCLRSVFERTSYRAFDAIVVDNGSVEDATAAVLDRWTRREGGRIRVLRDGQVFNYSRLNNRAARETDAPYLLLLNNDTEVISPDWMTAMLGQARRAPIGAVGALLLYEDGTIQHAGVIMGGVLGLAGHAYRYGLPDGEASRDVLFDRNFLAVTGACLMVAHAKFDAVGGLDETLAVGYNDVDLCLKLRRAGFRNVMVPRARLYHYESKSRGHDDTQEKAQRALAESEIIRTRWPEWSENDPYYNPNLTRSAEDFSVRA